MRVSMVYRTCSRDSEDLMNNRDRAAGALAGGLAEVEFGQLQIAWLSNLQINRRAVYHGDGQSGAFDNRGFIGAHKTIRGGFGKGLLQQAVAKALRRLRQHD